MSCVLGTDIPEHGILRWHELALSQAASAAGLSPPVVHHQDGCSGAGRFSTQQTFTEADVRDAANLPRIGH